jgi:hypothetical protein
VELVHARLVELDVLFNVNLITVHNVSEAVRNLVSQVLLGLLILLRQQLSVQFGILLIKELA